MTKIIYARRTNERYTGSFDWIKSRHTFSFANYFDRDFMGFFALRVINDDIIASHRGVGAHPHENMEISNIHLKRCRYSH
ncbi:MULTISPECIES: pirin family protein [Campylobacter]|uniref:pirin family protein n=1 Tax=Campylobacter TaxID=194 RepID=UPI001B8D25B7|nr:MULTISPECIES: pirin family protein [unclassified Campylobacter]